MERHQRQVGLLSLSLIDDLTGLSNRKGFLGLARQHARLARRTRRRSWSGSSISTASSTSTTRSGIRRVITHWSKAADVLRDSFRQSDIVGRYGGDEFAVIVSDAPHGSIAIVIERIQQRVRPRNQSVPSDDLDELLHRADALMYREKRARRPVR
jgi:GGDEF domain-containing protein